MQSTNAVLWKSGQLNDIAQITMGQSPDGSSYNFHGEGIGLINGPTEFTNKYPVVRQWTTKPTKLCRPGDILLCVRGSSTGRMNLSDAEYCIGRGVASISAKEGKGVTGFLYYLLDYKISQLLKKTAGSTFPNLSSDEIRNMEISIPSLEEQNKIAVILSTWDKAIELKEKLIEQKKEQKKGLMQRLLTGKVRLKGFEGEWEEIELGDLGEFKTSSVDKKVDDNQQFVDLVNYMDVYHNRIIDDNINFMKVSASDREIETFNVEYGDVLFTPSSETPDDIGHSAVVKIRNKKALYSYHLVRMRFKREMDINFKAYIFNSDAVLKEFSRRATGATRYTLSIKDFQEIRIRIPKNLDEQRKIGDILLLADNEIKLLQQELEALKQQKKGLMQLLLTGKVRVKC